MANPDENIVSLAIETSCRAGGIALGIGGELVREIAFDASARHTVHLVDQMKQILASQRLKAADLSELYISCGPGSFTGIRVGVTVARTLGQVVAGLRCVAVPTVEAVAQNASDLAWEHLAVVMDAKENFIYRAVFARSGGQIVPTGEVGVVEVEEFSQVSQPTLLMGEGLLYHQLQGQGLLTLAPSELYFPTARSVWTVGRAMASKCQFTDYHQLLPIYARKPEAVRLWEKRQHEPGATA